MMETQFKEEIALIEDSVRTFLETNYSFVERKKYIALEAGYAEQHWQQMIDLGWMQLSISEQFGGLGGSSRMLAPIMRQFGRNLFMTPFLTNAITSTKLLEFGAAEPLRLEMLNAIGEGSAIVTSALYEPHSRYELNNTATTVRKNTNSYQLNGTKVAVQYGNIASHYLVLARTDGNQVDAQGLTLFLVDSKTKGIDRQDYRTHDGGCVSTIHFNNVYVEDCFIASPLHQALPLVERTINFSIAAVCNEMTGILEALLEQTLEYLKTRTQFNRKIASFQAIQHRMVDMYMRMEMAKSMANEAVRAVDTLPQPQQDLLISAAKLQIGDVGILNAEEAIQLHGAMGMTDELAIGHYLKRMLSLNLMFGDPAYHRRRYRKLSTDNHSVI